MSSVSNWKLRMLVVWVALAVAVGLYGLLGWLVVQSPGTHHVQHSAQTVGAQLARQALPGVILIALMAGLLAYQVVLARRLRGAYDGGADHSPERRAHAGIFVGMIVMLSLFQLVGVFGLFCFDLGAPLRLELDYVTAAEVLLVIGGLRTLIDARRLTGLA